MKGIRIIGLMLAVVGFNAMANVKCPESEVLAIHHSDDKVLVQLGNGVWHVLAVKDGKNKVDKKLSRAMKAYRKGLMVELTFPKGYDATCKAADRNVAAKNIKVLKAKTYRETQGLP